MSDKPIDYNLFNSFMLNEIKGKEDSLRHLISINIILIGAYITVLGNFGLKLFDLFGTLTFLSESWIIVIPVVLLTPVIIWIASTMIMMEGLKPLDFVDKTFGPSTSSNALIKINSDKYSSLRDGEIFTLSALSMVTVLINICILWLLAFKSH